MIASTQAHITCVQGAASNDRPSAGMIGFTL